MGCSGGSTQAEKEGLLAASKKSSGAAAVRPCALDPIEDLGGVKPKKLLIAIHALDDEWMDKTPGETPAIRCERIALVLEGVEKSRSAVAADLAIFVAPETYYSHMGSGGELRYNPDECGQVLGLLQGIGRKFPNVLLLPGSITWSQGPIKARAVGQYHNFTPDQLDRVHNTLPIVFGAQYTSYHKKQDIDCIPHRPERFDIPPRKHGIVRVAGLLLGLSICGDSYCLDEDYPELQKGDALGAADLDVQVLIARGQGMDASKHLRAGGLTIRADGINSADPAVRCGVTRKGAGAVAAALTTGDDRTRVLYYGPFDL